MPAPKKSTRPAGISALSAFFAFGTLASGLSAVSLLFPGGLLEPMWRLNPRGHEGLLTMGHWAVLLMGVVCAACAASAYGFFCGKRWGYRLGIAVLFINLTGDVINGFSGKEPRALFGVPVVALILWYLSSKNVRTFFRLVPGNNS